MVFGIIACHTESLHCACECFCLLAHAFVCRIRFHGYVGFLIVLGMAGVYTTSVCSLSYILVNEVGVVFVVDMCTFGTKFLC